MAKYKFEKYAYEDIRTEYLQFDATHIAPDAIIPSRTNVKFDSVSNKLVAGGDNDVVNNTTILLLAEDAKPGDTGLVYYIIENTSNLVKEA